MEQFTEQDKQFMQLAINLAKKGQFTTHPNPSVGCVIVNDNQVVGRGFHFKAGEPHAEVMALREAQELVKNAIAYVTLEPCSHYGRTPPCAKGLIDAGISKVIVAMKDPNPLVSGKGLKMLTDAGIKTQFGLLAEQAELLNQGFLTRMRTGKPFVQLKMAMSLDGKTAMANGESKWITSEISRQDVQQARAKSAAILSTSQTVLADDPSLNVRWEQFSDTLKDTYPKEIVRQPIRVIIDNHHQVKPTHKLFKIKSPVWLVSKTERDISNFPEFCEHIQLNVDTSQSYLQELLIELGKKQINSLWIEGGATLAGAFISENLVDELIVYIAPKLLGHQARDLCYLPQLTQLSDAPLWKLEKIETLSSDIKAVYCRGE